MTLSRNAPEATSEPAAGVWRPLLRARLLGRAEPLFVGSDGLRSAASLWSGAQMWAQLLRTAPNISRVVVTRAERLSLLQLLIATLWDGRTLQIGGTEHDACHDAWHLDGHQVWRSGQAACPIDRGGWPELSTTKRLTPVDMLRFAPELGHISVPPQQASHDQLWLALGAPLSGAPPTPKPAPDAETLAPFDLGHLTTPADVLSDALLPLLRSHEVWEANAQG